MLWDGFIGLLWVWGGLIVLVFGIGIYQWLKGDKDDEKQSREGPG